MADSDSDSGVIEEKGGEERLVNWRRQRENIYKRPGVTTARHQFYTIL